MVGSQVQREYYRDDIDEFRNGERQAKLLLLDDPELFARLVDLYPGQAMAIYIN